MRQDKKNHRKIKMLSCTEKYDKLTNRNEQEDS